MEEDLSVLSRKANPPDQTLRYGKHADQIADLRLGFAGADRPLLVLIHGGFWKPEYDRLHTEAMSSALSAAGWNVLTLEYRRIPGEPDLMMQDIEQALLELPSTIPHRQQQLILIGHSAGGHLALWAASRFSYLHGVLALAPAANLRLASELDLGDNAVRRFLGTAAEQRGDLDPILLPKPTMKVYVLQGLEDVIVPPSVPSSYCDRFPEVAYRELSDCGHFALIDPLSTAWQMVVQTLLELSQPTSDAK